MLGAIRLWLVCGVSAVAAAAAFGCGGSGGRRSLSAAAALAGPDRSTPTQIQESERSRSAAYKYPIADDRQDDERIRTYGHEAGEPNKREITALVERYYHAAAAANGAEACLMLPVAFARSVPEDYGSGAGSSGLKGTTCAVVLTKFFRQLPGQPIASLKAVQVIGVRVKRNSGYAQLSSKWLPTAAIGLIRERGQWRIDTLIGGGCRHCYR
jgi:hypothetical protein